MSAALRFGEAHATMRPSVGASFRPSMCPTLVPTSLPTTRPRVDPAMSATAPPSTQRSATFHSRFEAAVRAEQNNVLTAMRLNAEFLMAILCDNLSPIALEALADLQRAMDRLEHAFPAQSPGHSRAR